MAATLLRSQDGKQPHRSCAVPQVIEASGADGLTVPLEQERTVRGSTVVGVVPVIRPAWPAASNKQHRLADIV